MASRLVWGAVAAGTLVAGLAVVAYFVKATPEERAVHLAALALRTSSRGDPVRAEQFAREAIEAFPDCIQAHMALGRILAAAGRDDEAVAPLARAAAASPPSVEASLLLATVHLRRGEHDAALLATSPVLQSAPHPAHLLRADIRLARGDPLGGLEELESAASAPGAGPPTLLRAASLARILGRRLRNEDLTARATSLYRRCADPLTEQRTDVLSRAAALVGLGAADAAYELVATESGVEAARLRASALALRGGFEEAERELRDALATSSDPALHAALLRLLVASWRLDGANAAAEEALRRHPGDPLVRRAALEAAGAWRAARDARGLVFAVTTPEEPLDETWNAWMTEPDALVIDAPEARAVRLAARGPDLLAALLGTDAPDADPRRTAAEIEALLRKGAGEPDVEFWRAAFALVRGEAADARKAAVEATAKAEEWPDALALRALVYVATGESDLAVEDARAAVSLRPDRSRFRAVLAQALLASGDADASAHVARSGLDVEPGDVRLITALAEAVAKGARSDEGERVAVDAALAVARGDLDAAARLLSGSSSAWHDARVAAVVPALWEVDAYRWAAIETERPEDPEPAIRRAESLTRAGQFLHARDVLQAAAARTQSAEVELRLASLLATLGDLRAAEEIFARLLRASPQSAPARIAMARVRMGGGDARGASVLLRDVLASGASLEERLSATRLLLLSADPTAEDVAAVRTWASGADAPHDASAKLVEACIAFAEGRFDDAATAARAAVGTPGAQSVLALATLRAGKAAEAEAIVDAALAADGGSPETRAAAAFVHVQVACAALARGDATAAAVSARRGVVGTSLDSLAAVVLAVAIHRGAPAEEPAGEARELTRASPASPAAYVFLAQSAMIRDDPHGALVHVQKALTRAPANRISLALMVEASRRVDDFAGAEAACRRAIAAGDRSGAADLLLGTLREGRGDEKGALAAYLTALERQPGNLAALRRAGTLLARAGRLEEVRQRVRAARVGRGGASRDLLVARWLGAAGDVSGAAEVLTDVVDSGADGAPVQIEWGRLHLLGGELAEAERCFEAALTADPTQRAAYFGLLTALHRQGKIDDARRVFAATVAERPADPVPRTILGILAEARDRVDEAEEEYRRALAVSPGMAVAANNLAWLLAVKRSQPAEGLPFAEIAVRSAPGDPDVLDTYGWILHLAGRSADALAPCEKACRIRPKDASFHLRRAEILAQLDRVGPAAEAFDLARKLDPRLETSASARLRMAVQRAGR